jgi:chromate reductase, NAD(P)H dehydrogenase (quinone)
MRFAIASLAGLPFYSTDVEQQGMPAAVQSFRNEIGAADALLFAVPEYNLSISGALKNALEWLSRPPSPPANAKPCTLFGASVSPLGTARGQFHFRHVCVSLNLIPVNAPHVDIASAKDKFDPEGRLVDQSSLDQVSGPLACQSNINAKPNPMRKVSRSSARRMAYPSKESEHDLPGNRQSGFENDAVLGFGNEQ